MSTKLALDTSLEKARALHRVWRALNDGDCPKCHTYHPATEMLRGETFIQCPSCKFDIERTEIDEIEKMFAPAMDAAVAIFEQWKNEKRKPVRREWHLDGEPVPYEWDGPQFTANGHVHDGRPTSGGIHVREVFPGDEILDAILNPTSDNQSSP